GYQRRWRSSRLRDTYRSVAEVVAGRRSGSAQLARNGPCVLPFQAGSSDRCSSSFHDSDRFSAGQAHLRCPGSVKRRRLYSVFKSGILPFATAVPTARTSDRAEMTKANPIIAEHLCGVYRSLRRHFGYTPQWWPGTPFEIAISAILVQQCGWQAAARG